MPKPEETQGLDRPIRLSFKNGTLSLAFMSLFYVCICHLFLNSLKNRSFKLGYYLFFVLTGKFKTSLLEGLNCKSLICKSLIVRQSVSLWRPFQSLISLTGVNHKLVLLKPAREKQSPGINVNFFKRKNKLRQDYFPGLTENLLIQANLLRASPPPLSKRRGRS